MGLGGGCGGATAAPVFEGAPTEDTISALLEVLVEPLLPAGVPSAVSEEPISADQEATVAKQVQAVVILYDYYHRKQNPELEYLDFISFCKLAVVLKPRLLTYMKAMRRADLSELVDLEKEASLMEKMVLEACDLAKGLESLGKSEDVVAGWPISKVGVFLVDNRKENCLLLHNSCTLGVWSVIEKETSLGLLPGSEEKRGTKKKRITKKPQRGNRSVDEDGLLQLAFAAVKDAFGISQSNLKVLETQTVYSLSKEKTAARFFIVQCIESNIEFNYLPISDVIDSLRGPLLRKEACSWSTTSVVEYFHMLPYADVISNWFVRVSFMDTTEHSHRAEEPAVDLLNKKRKNSQTRCGLDKSSGLKLSNSSEETYNMEDKGNFNTEDKAVSSSQYGVQDHDSAPSDSSPGGFKKMDEIISSKGSLLSQTASKYLHRKRDMLYLQLHDNQNEIALCDKNIDTILRGGADALAVTLDTLMEVCNAASSQDRPYHHVQEHKFFEYPKQKRPFEAKLSVQNPCQARAGPNVLQEQLAISNLPCIKTRGGGCQSHVEVNGTDFKLSVKGPVCGMPQEAKEASASSILTKLRSIMASLTPSSFVGLVK